MNRILPILLIVLGLGIGTINYMFSSENDGGRGGLSELIDSSTTLPLIAESLSLPASNAPRLTPTTIVVVLPNGDAPPTQPTVPIVQQPPVILPPARRPILVSNPIVERGLQPIPATKPVIEIAPIITVTATAEPDLSGLEAQIHAQATAVANKITFVTATVEPTPTLEPEPTAEPEIITGHCSEWTNGCEVIPTATIAPTYAPPPPTSTTVPNEPPPTAAPTMTPLPPTPTITSTPLPENNSISSIVTLQGSKNHGNTTVIITGNEGVVTHMVTNEGGLFQGMGLDKGTYQLAAYSANGSHLPACTTVTVGGNESIAIPQTMLRSINFSDNTSDTDETINIGAAALVAIQFGLSIPEHLVPILDVNHDSVVNETDANMLIANPRLLSCQAW